MSRKKKQPKKKKNKNKKKKKKKKKKNSQTWKHIINEIQVNINHADGKETQNI